MTSTLQPAQTPVVPAQPKTSALAVTALVLAFIPVVGLLGVLLGIIALIRISKRPTELRGKGFAIAAIATFGMWVVMTGVLAAIAIPQFNKFSSRSRQMDVKVNLKSLYVAQKANLAETDTLATTFEAMNWQPDVGSRYTYYMASDRMPPGRGEAFALPATVESYVRSEAGQFRAVGVGNVDTDATLDVWTIDESNNLVNVINDLDD